MKLSALLLATLSSFAIAAAMPAAAQSHDHGHEAAPAKLKLDQGGKKWQTDEPLRQAMAAMQADFAARLHAIHDGSLAQDGYAALGKTVETQVGAIVSQCKLDPKADAVLHVVVAKLIHAADVMQGKAKGKPAAAAHQAVLALNDYGRYFDHPGWQPIK